MYLLASVSHGLKLFKSLQCGQVRVICMSYGFACLGVTGENGGGGGGPWFGHEVKRPWAVSAIWAAIWLSQGLVAMK